MGKLLGAAGRVWGRRRRVSPAPIGPIVPDVFVVHVLATVLDRDYYLKANPDVARAACDPVDHYAVYGWREGRDPAPWFSTNAYLDAHPSLRPAGVNPLYHFLTVGWHERSYPLNAGWQDHDRLLHFVGQGLEVPYYLRLNDDIDGGRINPVEHYAYTGWREGRDPAVWFITEHYLSTNPDVAQAGINPLHHFLSVGRFESRAPLPLREGALDWGRCLAIQQVGFDEDYYGMTNPDVVDAGLDPLEHFASTGWREGRQPNPTFDLNAYADRAGLPADVNPWLHHQVLGRFVDNHPSQGPVDLRDGPNVKCEVELDEILATTASAFDRDYYTATYPDVAAAGVDPLRHFVETGWREMRNPTADFHTAYYLEANPDAAEADVNPLHHYLRTGQREGRRTLPPGGSKSRALADLAVLRQRLDPALVPPTDLLGRSSLAAAWRQAALAGDRLVLAVGHDDYRRAVGGIQVCIAEEQIAFNAAGSDYVLITPTSNGLTLRCEEAPPSPLTVILNGRSLGAVTPAVLVEVIRDFTASGCYSEQSLVLHALQGHTMSQILTLTSGLGLTSGLLWIHDFFSVCPGYNLLRNGIEYCGGPAPTSNACGICIFGEHRVRHLQAMGELFASIDLTIVSPSAAALAVWKATSSLPYRASIVHEHRRLGDDLGPVPAVSVDSPVRVGFAGHPHVHKGWPLFERLIGDFGRDGRYEYCHLGVERVGRQGLDFFEVRTTPDDPAAMSTALSDHGVEAVVLASTWPETFSLIAYESIAAGCFIVTTASSGNIAAVVTDLGCGVVGDDEDHVAELFRTGEIARLTREYRGSARRRELATSQSSIDVILEGIRV